MTKKFLLLLITLLLIVVIILAWQPSISNSVSVVFVGYTNVGPFNFGKQSTSAFFRIENRSPYALACRQGALDIERIGSWNRNTNWVGRQYDPILNPGQSLTLSLIAPPDATRWRSSFLLTKITHHSSLYWERYFRFERFMDSLRLDRLGIRGRPWTYKEPAPVVVTSRVIDL